MSGQVPVKKRIMVFLAIVLLWQLVILGKVFYLKVFRSDFYEMQARAQRNDIVRVPATRGRILDCRLETLAASVPFDSVYVYTPEVEDKDRTARALAGALGLDAHQILMKMDGQLKFRYIKRFITPAESRQVKALNLAGVGLLAENRRIFPNGCLASHVLGTVTLANDSESGLEGIEKVYDRHLAGQPGELFIQKDGKSNVLTTSVLNPPQSGQTLVLNIDSRIQHIAERELRAGVEKYQAAAGMVVILEPRTGHILALANYPDFDPNSLKGTPLSNLRDLAVERYFEPGSTFKIVTASAALEEGLTTPDEIIYCGNGFISLSGHIIRDHKPFQNLSFNEVIANSSDVGAIKLGLRLGEVMFHRYICAFGFGERTAVDLPAEEPGYIRKPSNWSGISIGAVSMGQEVGVTGVQMARAMAAVANGGYLVRPMVVDRILDENGRLVQRFEPERIRIISGRTAEILRNALVMTVDKGTARKAGVPGYSIAGKTGTAQKFDFEARAYSKTDFVASFIGFAPADRPQFVAAVIFDSPRPLYHGGDVSAPVFAEIARNIFLLKTIQPSTPIPELASSSPSPAPPATVPAAAPTPAEDSLLAMDEGQRETVMSLIPEGSFTMPDFTGKSLRAVLKECARMGLVLQPSGSGVAVEQIPPAGALIKPASRCTVWFSTDVQKISTILRPGDNPGPEAAKNILSRNSSQ